MNPLHILSLTCDEKLAESYRFFASQRTLRVRFVARKPLSSSPIFVTELEKDMQKVL